MLFRAVRLVIDTGLHHKKWTRDYAVDRYVKYLDEGEETARNAIDRYCVWPGQACAYMIGKERFLELRESFRDARQKIDYKRFHDKALKYGALPLDVLSEMAFGFGFGSAGHICFRQVRFVARQKILERRRDGIGWID